MQEINVHFGQCFCFLISFAPLAPTVSLLVDNCPSGCPAAVHMSGMCPDGDVLTVTLSAS